MSLTHEAANPLLYQVNTRVLLGRMRRLSGRPASLDDIADETLRAIKALGFDWVWFLGVWQLGEAGRRVSRAHAAWRQGFRQALPDLVEADITGSPFAVSAWHADDRLGGDAALARLRERARAAGLRLMLDFVPNHLALDHPWVVERPDLFVRGSEALRAAEPENWVRLAGARPDLVLAHGRDPYFPGWPDTAQLDYSNPDTRSAMGAVLADIAGRCDGVRCDMAMLLLPEVFERCWSGHLQGRRVAPFWPEAIQRLRLAHPGFRLMAEVYWGLEAVLLDQGFDWAYDKALYDALHAGDAPRLRAILSQPQDAQRHCARFLENHDEPRAAACFDPPRHKAAAVLSFCVPGLHLLHQGQLEGARAHVPIHLDRGPIEAADPVIGAFYGDLMRVLRDPALRQGSFTLLSAAAAWGGNPSHAGFVAFCWSDEGGPRLLGIVNYRADRGQCRVRLDHPALSGRLVTLSDRTGPEHYARDGSMMANEGLYVDLPGWGHNLFEIG